MPDVGLDTAAIVSTVCEGILYGFSVLMFIGTLWTMVHGSTWKQVNHLMFVVAILLFILSSAHMAIDIKRIDEGFVTQRETYPGGPIAFFANSAQYTFVAKNAIYSFQTILGDGIVIYRCFKVWQSWWIIVFPMILWCSVAATAFGSVYTVAHSGSADSIFIARIGQWITAFYATTLACNFIATSLLAYRLWSIDQAAYGLRIGESRIRPALMIVMDAGILYSATLFAALLCFVQKSNGQYVVLDMIMPIISISFYMIILRVAMSSKDSRGNTSGSIAYTSRIGSNYPMRPLQIHMDHSMEVEPKRNFSVDQNLHYGKDSHLDV